jgi:hypothetical protein
MKVFTLGNHGYVTVETATILGANTQHRQVRVLICARSKAEAFRLLGDRGIGPGSITDPQFQRETPVDGDVVDMLTNVGLLDAPAVYALHRTRLVGPVVRIEPDGSPAIVGHIELAGGESQSPARFVPTPAGVDAPAWTEAATVDTIAQHVAELYRIDLFRATELTRECAGLVLAAHGDGEPRGLGPDGMQFFIEPGTVTEILAAVGDQFDSEEQTKDDLLYRLTENARRVAALTQELEELRDERRRTCRSALDLGADVPLMAAALGVSPGRIYQLRDEALVAESNARRANAGLVAAAEREQAGRTGAQ